MPANAEITYKIILAIATFDLPYISDGTNFIKRKLVSVTSESELIVNKTDKRRQLVTLSKSTQDSGYNTANPFVNSAFTIMVGGSIAIVFLIVLVLYFVC